MNHKPNYYYLILFLLSFVMLQGQNKYIAPRPVWVKEVQLPDEKMDTRSLSDGYYYFLHDYQVHVPSQHYYYHYAYKIYNANGVEAASSLQFSYNPSYERIKIHSVKILRGGETIDKTKQLDLKVLQREKNLEKNIYDERLTLSTFLEDVRQGDIVEYSYSIIGDNPIFDNKFYFSFYGNSEYAMKLIHCRILKPASRKFYITYLNEKREPAITTESGMECMTWELKDPKVYVMDPSTPGDYDPYNLVEVSEYNKWTDVAEWAKSVFYCQFTPSPALKAKLEEFKAMKSKDKQVMEVLRFVQNEIRYLGIEIGVNSHKPRNPTEVFKTRYGDCKDKALLCCYFLNELELYARPVLVHSSVRGGVIKRAVSPNQFDHVIIQVNPQGFRYYFDPTINFQEGDLRNYYTPNYRLGLVVGSDKDSLIDFQYTRNFDAELKEHFVVHSTDGKATLNVKTKYHGWTADYNRSYFDNKSKYEIADTYRDYYRKQFKGVEPVGELEIKDSKLNNIFSVAERYEIGQLWTDSVSKPGVVSATFAVHFLAEDINRIDISLQERKDPLSLPHPISVKHTIDVDLPEAWSIEIEPLLIENNYFSYTRKVYYIESTHKLTLEYEFKTRQNSVPPHAYSSFKKDLETVINDLYYTLYFNKGINEELDKSSSINPITFGIFLFAAQLFILIAIFIYRRAFYKPGNDEVPLRLGGMINVAVGGLFIHAMYIVFSFIGGHYFSKAAWLLYTDPNSMSYIKGYDAVNILEIIMKALFLFYASFLIILIIRHSHLVPKLVVAYIVLFILYNIVDSVLVFFWIDRSTVLWNALRVVLSMAGGGIFIPLFLTSERAEQTFIK